MDKSYVCSLPSILMVVIILVGFASADLDKYREHCTDQLVGLVACLPYVGGDAKAPPLDCFTDLKPVLQQSKICLCILIKDRNDPKLGLKINATIALGLPAKCNSLANFNDCPSLLKVPPGSPDAKLFEDFANTLKGNGTITAPTGKGNNGTSDGSGTAKIKSDSGRGRKWLGLEMALGLLIFVSCHIFSNLCFFNMFQEMVGV